VKKYLFFMGYRNLELGSLVEFYQWASNPDEALSNNHNENFDVIVDNEIMWKYKYMRLLKIVKFKTKRSEEDLKHFSKIWRNQLGEEELGK
jgi:hypothetical protein